MSMSEQVRPEGAPRYQGWANYPTWAVHLWLANDEMSYLASQDILARAASARDGGEALREWIEGDSPLEGASMYADILGWALQIVDWDAVSRAIGPDDWDDTDPPAIALT
ncbi:MAG: hypothetical protein DCC49_09240 [Acidobacteria bacterium]|nr:MAG: hypothetical protein DCC49_09240 [Acidobacteriota bacterium]